MKISDLFTCDQCGAHEIEEVMVGVILTSRVESIDGVRCGYCNGELAVEATEE